MVGIKGLGGVSEPLPERPTNVRDRRRDEVTTSKSQDGVVISSEAQAAAKLASLIREANMQPDVRLDRVETAKERMDRGDYKNPEVVRKVAERVAQIVTLE